MSMKVQIVKYQENVPNFSKHTKLSEQCEGKLQMILSADSSATVQFDDV